MPLLFFPMMLVGALLSYFTGKRKIYLTTSSFILLALSNLTVITLCVVFYVGINDDVIINQLLQLRSLLELGMFLTLGYFLHSLKLTPELVNRTRLAALQTSVVALSIWIASFFIMVAIGKYRHLDEMKTFFTQSGLPPSFLYVVIGSEIIGALGIALNHILRTGVPASVILLIITIGAIFTHLKNGDPIVDSYDAIRQFTGLIFLIVLLRKKHSIVNANTTPK